MVCEFGSSGRVLFYVRNDFVVRHRPPGFGAKSRVIFVSLRRHVTNEVSKKPLDVCSQTRAFMRLIRAADQCIYKLCNTERFSQMPNKHVRVRRMLHFSDNPPQACTSHSYALHSIKVDVGAFLVETLVLTL